MQRRLNVITTSSRSRTRLTTTNTVVDPVVRPSNAEMFFHATLARSFIQSLRTRGDDDFVDRLNYYYTPIMLCIACLIISAKQYGGTPIECWVNPHSRESMEEYIESYCFIQNTYWVPMYENIPDDTTAREGRQISYYQWVPFILLAEALMFTLPCLLWRLLNWQTGINIQHMINSACNTHSLVQETDRLKSIDLIAAQLIAMIDMQRARTQAAIGGRYSIRSMLSGSHVSLLYLITKLLYTGNIVLQFMMLNAALRSSDYAFFGFQVLSDLLHGRPWTESGHFPRVTLCDFEVRYLANLNRYTVQCALLINIINEKVFAYFWCWYLVLASVTGCSTTFWLINCLMSSQRIDFVQQYLRIANEQRRIVHRRKGIINSNDSVIMIESMPHRIDSFVIKFLQLDGIFILRLMANHAGDMIVMQVVMALWHEYCKRCFDDDQNEMIDDEQLSNQIVIARTTIRTNNIRYGQSTGSMDFVTVNQQQQHRMRNSSSTPPGYQRQSIDHCQTPLMI